MSASAPYGRCNSKFAATPASSPLHLIKNGYNLFDTRRLTGHPNKNFCINKTHPDRIEGDKNIIYSPDLIDIEAGKETAFSGLDYLVADGSSVFTNMVRNKDGRLYGHTTIKTVINWCKKYRIKNLIITHCGKQIVTMNKKDLDKRIGEYSKGMVKVKIAYDGYRTSL